MLVTGGGGFIGSHCIIELFKGLVADNRSNSSSGKEAEPFIFQTGLKNEI